MKDINFACIVGCGKIFSGLLDSAIKKKLHTSGHDIRLYLQTDKQCDNAVWKKLW